MTGKCACVVVVLCCWLFVFLPVALAVKDVMGRYVLVNATAAEWLGADNPQALRDKTDFDIYPIEQAALLDDAEGAVRAGEVLNYVEEVPDRITGEVRRIQATKIPLTNDAGVWMRPCSANGNSYAPSSIRFPQKFMRRIRKADSLLAMCWWQARWEPPPRKPSASPISTSSLAPWPLASLPTIRRSSAPGCRCSGAKNWCSTRSPARCARYRLPRCPFGIARATS